MVTPRPHRVRQRITHHVPAHVWGWNPSVIMVAHMHLSVNTTIDICETHSWCTVTLACVCTSARSVALGCRYPNEVISGSLERAKCTAKICFHGHLAVSH